MSGTNPPPIPRLPALSGKRVAPGSVRVWGSSPHISTKDIGTKSARMLPRPGFLLPCGSNVGAVTFHASSSSALLIASSMLMARPSARSLSNISIPNPARAAASARSYTTRSSDTSTAPVLSSDVPNTDPFWLYVERAYLHGVIGGYTDPARCPTGIPCFLPADNGTRGQTAKFVGNAFFPNCNPPR